MLHSVNVIRHRKTSAFIVNPFGTFKGHGGYVGIYPYRELRNPSNEQLGKLIIELLKQSGPAAYHIKDIESYRLENTDDETKRIRKAFFPKNKRRTTSSMAKEFSHGGVEFKSGQKSWLVRSRVFNAEDCDLKVHEERRIKLKDGPSSLGATVVEMLSDT